MELSRIKGETTGGGCGAERMQVSGGDAEESLDSESDSSMSSFSSRSSSRSSGSSSGSCCSSRCSSRDSQGNVLPSDDDMAGNVGAVEQNGQSQQAGINRPGNHHHRHRTHRQRRNSRMLHSASLENGHVDQQQQDGGDGEEEEKAK